MRRRGHALGPRRASRRQKHTRAAGLCKMRSTPDDGQTEDCLRWWRRGWGVSNWRHVLERGYLWSWRVVVTWSWRGVGAAGGCVGGGAPATGGKAAVNHPRSPTLPLASFPGRKKQSSQNNAVILAASACVRGDKFSNSQGKGGAKTH